MLCRHLNLEKVEGWEQSGIISFLIIVFTYYFLNLILSEVKFKKAFSFHLFQGVSRPCCLNSSPVWSLICSSDNYNKEGISTLLLYFGTPSSETLVLVFLVVSWSITWIFSKLPGLQFRTPADYPSWHAVILILGRSSCVRILTSLVTLLFWKSVLTDFIFCALISCFLPQLQGIVFIKVLPGLYLLGALSASQSRLTGSFDG